METPTLALRSLVLLYWPASAAVLGASVASAYAIAVPLIRLLAGNVVGAVLWWQPDDGSASFAALVAAGFFSTIGPPLFLLGIRLPLLRGLGLLSAGLAFLTISAAFLPSAMSGAFGWLDLRTYIVIATLSGTPFVIALVAFGLAGAQLHRHRSLPRRVEDH